MAVENFFTRQKMRTGRLVALFSNGPYSRRQPPIQGPYRPTPGGYLPIHISTKPRSGSAFKRGMGRNINSRPLLLLLREHTPSTQQTEGIRTMPCAAGELCLVPARTPERPDGHECHGKCGGRMHGLCGEADPDCDNPKQRVCHDCLAAKRSSKGKGKAVKPQAETARRQTRAVLGRGHARTQSTVVSTLVQCRRISWSSVVNV